MREVGICVKLKSKHALTQLVKLRTRGNCMCPWHHQIGILTAKMKETEPDTLQLTRNCPSLSGGYQLLPRFMERRTGAVSQ